MSWNNEDKNGVNKGDTSFGVMLCKVIVATVCIMLIAMWIKDSAWPQ